MGGRPCRCHASSRPKLAVHRASACKGCETAFANLGEKLLELAEVLDFAFCSSLLDAKRAEVEALADGELAVTLFDGAIPALSNLHTPGPRASSPTGRAAP